MEAWEDTKSDRSSVLKTLITLTRNGAVSNELGTNVNLLS